MKSLFEKIAAGVAIVGAVVVGAPAAHAISSYRDDVPNGRFNSCSTCHVSSFGGNPWNPFGKDVLRQDPDVTETQLSGTTGQNAGFNQTPAWDAALCNADSDGDLQTNGQELGDPNCVWAKGDAHFPRTTAISNPGVATSTSDDPDGLDPAGEGEGGGVEGEGGGEGEGQPPGPEGCPGCTSTGDAAFPIAGLVVSLFVLNRRRSLS